MYGLAAGRFYLGGMYVGGHAPPIQLRKKKRGEQREKGKRVGNGGNVNIHASERPNLSVLSTTFPRITHTAIFTAFGEIGDFSYFY